MLDRATNCWVKLLSLSDTGFYCTIFWLLFCVLFACNAAILAHYDLLAQTLLARSDNYFVLLLAVFCLLLQVHVARRAPHPFRGFALETGYFIQIICFTLLFSALSSLQMYFWIAFFGFMPLNDSLLAQADQALGFDWIGYLNWVKDTPWIRDLFYNAYYSIIWQVILLNLVSLYLRRQAILYRFVLANLIALLIVYITAGLFPAEGYITLKGYDTKLLSELHWPAGYAHVEYYRQLRAGGFTEVFKSGFIALITFPSYHTILAVLLCWGFWSIQPLRWLAVLFNIIVVASIPAIGGHYFSDCLAGLVVAAFVIWFCEKFEHTRQRLAADPGT